MTYRTLHDRCKNIEVPVGRKLLRDEIREITGKTLRIAKTTMDTRVCRGMYLAATNTTHKIVQQLGTNVVVLPREGNNYCWERFVEVKEYMHVFDSADEATDSGEEFDRLLADFVSDVDPERSPQLNAEIKAFWRALGVLCPEHVRQAILAEKAEKGPDLTDYAIAFRLRIPEQYVPRLLEPWYLEHQELLFT